MSGHEIDYSLRPAKQIERSMVFEACRRLNHFGNLEEYRYVGFGSYFFHDFRIVHRELGICDMVTIEGDYTLEERVRYNQPYACIDIRMGWSNKVLPLLNWEKPSVIWLDYTAKLNEVA